ncbi:TlpA disulfide reductase family protein [Solitalea lacus]|uniref:TlpA disulfide reductase family protein n=1 Tax=Solitalea lacus TaxID=2911172 RepID=UPI001EDA2B4C|nr:TlpA disulfide reductase family protein [Solitalea lacus]UKJ09060.1 AhpC/TSA family protein [Solitalea lacus]
MKKTLLGTALVLPLLAGSAYAQSGGYNITGKLTGLADGKKVYLLQQNPATGKVDTLSKTLSSAGAFQLKGSVQAPDIQFLGVQDAKGRPVLLFVENSKMSINGSVDDLSSITVTGSKTHDEYVKYTKLTSGINEQQKQLGNQYSEARKSNDKAKMDEIASKYDALDAEKSKITKDFASQNLQSYVTPFLLMQNVGDENAIEYNAMYEKFPSKIKESASAKSLKKRIDALLKTAVGQQAAMFTAKTPEGKDLSLKEVLSTGKYTMIDFWASWCGPCRAENPNVVKLYEKYHAKGFNILGVSLDRDGEKWKKAIADDKLTWNHVSDLKYWQSEYAAMYGVQAIPATFLLDANGKIVGKNLRGEELAKKLEELLGSM